MQSIWLKKKSNICSHPDGIDISVSYFTVKDTELLVSDRLFSVFKDDRMASSKFISEKSGYQNDINSEVGVLYNQEYYATKKMIYIQTGNTSPYVCIDKVNGTVVAVDPNAWKSKKSYTFPLDISNMQKTLKVCTDVWAIQLMEVSEFKKVCKKNGESYESALNRCGGDILRVKPGKYKITTFSAHRYSDRPIFFQMELVE